MKNTDDVKHKDNYIKQQQQLKAMKQTSANKVWQGYVYRLARTFPFIRNNIYFLRKYL